MSGVERLWALIGSGGGIVLVAVLAVRVFQSDALTWTVVLGILGIGFMAMAARIYDRRSQYVRRQQDYEDDRRAQRVAQASMMRALSAANAAGGSGGAGTWQAQIPYLLRDATTEDMVDALPATSHEVPDFDAGMHNGGGE